MNAAAPSARKLCSARSQYDSKLRQERHISEVAPTELGIFCGRTFYKEVAPLALGKGVAARRQSAAVWDWGSGGLPTHRYDATAQG